MNTFNMASLIPIYTFVKKNLIMDVRNALLYLVSSLIRFLYYRIVLHATDDLHNTLRLMQCHRWNKSVKITSGMHETCSLELLLMYANPKDYHNS